MTTIELSGKRAISIDISIDSQTPSKCFNLNNFKTYLETKKHIRSFDPVSGILSLGKETCVIHENGSVEGDTVLKTRIEKWIYDFLKTSE